jgi:hypothetical protein
MNNFSTSRVIWVTVLVVAIALIVGGILIYSLAPGQSISQRGIDLSFFTQLDQWLPAALGKQITGLLALITVQVLLAVALACVQKTFEWVKLADFYRSRVIPMLIGWLAFVILAKFATADILGPEYGVITGDGVSWLAWLAVVASLGARIVDDCKTIYGELLPFKAPAERAEK